MNPTAVELDSGMNPESAERTARWLVCMLERLGCPLRTGKRVLELGCGNGELVHVLRQRGIEAFGCDLQFKQGPRTESLRNAEWLKLIDTAPYRIPFESDYFDIVVSLSVLEHVMNLDETIGELSRITRPNGAGLHLFPSRYRLIEPHTYVPMGTMLRMHWWLRLWATLGVKNSFQAGLKPAAIAEANYRYLRGATNYLPRSAIRSAFEKRFATVRFREDVLVSCATGTLAYRLNLRAAIQHSRILMHLYSAARERAVWVEKGPIKKR